VTTFTYLIHHATEDAGITGLIYAGIVCASALTAIAAPTAERRRDARAVLKLMLRARHKDE
jgi:hypothetical protein